MSFKIWAARVAASTSSDIASCVTVFDVGVGVGVGVGVVCLVGVGVGVVLSSWSWCSRWWLRC